MHEFFGGAVPPVKFKPPARPIHCRCPNPSVKSLKIVFLFLCILFLMLLGSVTWAGSTISTLRKIQASRRIQAAVWLFTFAQIGGLAYITLMRSGQPETGLPIPRPFLAAIFFWHVLALPIFLTSRITTSVITYAAKVTRFFLGRSDRNVSDDSTECSDITQQPDGVSRRLFLGLAAQSSPALITIVSTPISQWQLEQFRVRRLSMVLPQLPAELDGLTVAHVSDTHVGRFTRGAILERIVETTNALDADFVLFTGDLINFSLGDLPIGIELLKGIRARHGIFACEGNHDLMQNGDLFRDHMNGASLGLLTNEAASVLVHGHRVQIMGLPWGEAPMARNSAGNRRDSLHKSLVTKISAKSDPDAFRILLAHHPHVFDHAHDFPLTLSGHTHGGQLMLSQNIGGGPSLYRYWSGIYQQEGRALCVSNGVGNWFPIRVGAPAEIVHLTLKSAALKAEPTQRPSA